MKFKKMLIICTVFMIMIAVPFVKADDEICYHGEFMCISLALGTCVGGDDVNDFDDAYIANDQFNSPLNYLGTNANPDLISYNCHYYTFFVTVNPRHYQMGYNYYQLNNDVSTFINSGTYVETDRYNAEIIVYYDSDGDITHSGRVLKAYDGTPSGICGDANLVQVISKWGGGFICVHRGDCCPYSGGEYGDGSTVKYYAYNHTHNIQITNSGALHNITCSNGNYCKLNILVPHTLVHTSSDSVSHLTSCTCFGCTYQVYNNHTINYSQHDESKHSKYCTLCNYQIYEYHNWQQFSDILFICNDCNQRARFIPIIHDGINPIVLMNSTNIVLYNGTYYYVMLDN